MGQNCKIISDHAERFKKGCKIALTITVCAVMLVMSAFAFADDNTLASGFADGLGSSSTLGADYGLYGGYIIIADNANGTSGITSVVYDSSDNTITYTLYYSHSLGQLIPCYVFIEDSAGINVTVTGGTFNESVYTSSLTLRSSVSRANVYNGSGTRGPDLRNLADVTGTFVKFTPAANNSTITVVLQLESPPPPVPSPLEDVLSNSSQFYSLVLSFGTIFAGFIVSNSLTLVSLVLVLFFAFIGVIFVLIKRKG